MQQHGSKYFAQSTPDPGIKRSKFIFFRTWSYCIIIKLKRITKCSNIVANVLPTDRLTLGWDQKVNIYFFSEHGHVAYQTKWNHECSNMVANISYLEITPTLEVGSKSQISTFSEHDHIAYQIKGNHNCSSMVAKHFTHRPQPPALGMAPNGRNSTFTDLITLHIKFKGNGA